MEVSKLVGKFGVQAYSPSAVSPAEKKAALDSIALYYSSVTGDLALPGVELTIQVMALVHCHDLFCFLSDIISQIPAATFTESGFKLWVQVCGTGSECWKCGRETKEVSGQKVHVVDNSPVARWCCVSAV